MPIILVVLVSVLIMAAADVVYVCEAGDPRFLGTFSKSADSFDGVPTYSNENDMSFCKY